MVHHLWAGDFKPFAAIVSEAGTDFEFDWASLFDVEVFASNLVV